MAETVVRRLEIVHVDEQQREARPARCGALDARGELFVEGRAVRHRGEHVVRGAVREHRMLAFHMALPALKLVEQRIDVAAEPVEFGDAEALHALVERSEEHTSELQSLMRISYAVFCLQNKKALIE